MRKPGFERRARIWGAEPATLSLTRLARSLRDFLTYLGLDLNRQARHKGNLTRFDNFAMMWSI